MRGLSETQKTRLATEGYLVVEDLLDVKRDIGPLLAEYETVLDGIADAFHAAGYIESRYDELPFISRVIRICRESGRSLSQYFDMSLPQTGVQPDTPIHLGPAVFDLLTNPALLAVAESVIGPEVFSNPVQHI